MTKTEYLNKRNEMLKEADNLINEGKLKEADELMNDVKKLDDDFSNEVTARANMEALKNSAPIPKYHDAAGEPKNLTVIDTSEVKDNKNDEMMVNAWCKYMMNKPMTDDENSAFTMMNEAMTTESHGILVPETIVSGIWKEVGEQYPLYNDIFKTSVKGILTVLKSDNSTEAKWYDEGTPTEDGNETFSSASLRGCELSRSITVSWKLKEMSIAEFIPFIQSMLAEKMGAAAAYGTFEGKGPAASDSSDKDEPRGIKTALLADSKKEQVVTVTGEPTYKNITSMIAKVKGAYKKGAKFYAKGSFIWDTLANITDKNGKPYFIGDTTAGGVGRMLGFVVEEDDSVDTLLFGNPNKGYHMNINKAMTIDTEDHKKPRNTDYIAYAIMDGDVRTLKAFSYLEKTNA